MINTCAVGGRLTKDAELKYRESGEAFLTFSIANEVGWGEKKKVSFFDCARFQKGAEGLAPYLKKGMLVHVQGQISSRTHDGKTYFGITVYEVALPPKPKEEQEDHGQDDTIPF
jgi:single-strand DNA-binding protein